MWSTTQNPTIDLTTKTNDGSGTGSFTSTITELTANTTYYVRAYATNSVGTAYGNEVSFPTNEQPLFYLSENGITCKCENANVGDIGVINGIEYEAVDRDLLIQRRDEGADLTRVCTSLVTDMSEMFMGDYFYPYQFNQPIGNWDMSNVTNMRSIFFGSHFNQPIADWNVSNVTNMEYMFRNSSFNQGIGSWDVSNVTNMVEMFRESGFNQDISGWCVSNIPSEPQGFSQGAPLTPENKPVWGTCP